MSLEVFVEEEFPQPVETVWKALTDSQALATWLMDNDFQPRVGVKFTMKCPPLPGVRSWVEAEVLELAPPRRMTVVMGCAGQ